MRRALLTLVLAGLLTRPAVAGIFGWKTTKPNPAQRVPELLNILKADGDENKRIEAAQELRYYDPTAFPAMVPALIEALQNDAKPSVRAESADTLGKLNPISQQAGQALEAARDKDTSMRVRLQARSSLLGYYWRGYKSTKPPDSPNQGREPPLLDPKADTAPVIQTQTPTTPRTIRATGEPSLPPVNQSLPPSKPPSPPSAPPSQPSRFSLFGPRPMPSGPTRPVPQTREPPLAPPLSQVSENLPIATQPLAVPQPVIPMPLPLPIATQPSSGTGPELPPQDP